MAGSKKLLAIGLALALTVPATAYAEETTTTTTYKIAEQEIKDASGETVGNIVCTAEINPENFVKEIELTAAVLKADGAALENITYSWADPYAEDSEGSEGGTEDSESNPSNLPTYKVSESGTYIVTVDLTNANTGWNLAENTVKLSVEVKNVDITGPTVTVTKTPEEWTKDKVTITVSAVDHQPAMSASEAEAVASGAPTTLESISETSEVKTGSGLHAQPYSYDGGSTWTDKNTYEVTENKTINFVARDILGNQTTQTIEVTNIDKAAPTASLAVSDGELYEGEEGIVTLTATASDAESGLAEKAYSWDGGNNWYAGPSATVPTVGTYSVMVRDKVGNTATASVTVTYSEKETESETETEDNTGGGTTGGSTGGTTGGTTGGSTGGTTGGSTGGTTGGSTGGTTGGSTGGTTGGSTGGSSNTNNNNSTGNSDWEDNSHISGIVNTPSRETDETSETDETAETDETETDETKETKETKQTKETKESETKEVLQTPITEEKDGFNFPIGLALIIAAILIVLSIIILVIKMMLDRHAAAAAEDDDEEEDMRKVYARVDKEANKVAAAATTAAGAKVSKEAKAAKEEPKKAVASGLNVDDMEIEAAIGASVAAAIADEEPVVKKIQRKHEASSETVKEVEGAVAPEDEISIGEFAAAAVAAGIAVVDDEKEMEAAISEMEEEKAAHMAGGAAAAENVVIEGEHSRLIIDPETGEYKYEFK